MQELLAGSTELAGPELNALLDASRTLLRVLDRYVGHQVRELARPVAAGVPAQLQLSLRKGKSDTIRGYAPLLAATFLAADEAFVALRGRVRDSRSSWALQWAGVVPPPTTR